MLRRTSSAPSSVSGIGDWRGPDNGTTPGGENPTVVCERPDSRLGPNMPKWTETVASGTGRIIAGTAQFDLHQNFLASLMTCQNIPASLMSVRVQGHFVARKPPETL